MKGRRGTKRKVTKQGPVSSTGDNVSAPVCLLARKKSTLETGTKDNMLCTEEPLEIAAESPNGLQAFESHQD